MVDSVCSLALLRIFHLAEDTRKRLCQSFAVIAVFSAEFSAVFSCSPVFCAVSSPSGVFCPFVDTSVSPA